MYAADQTFWRVYIEDIKRVFSGELWTVSEVARDQYGLYWLACMKGEGLSREPNTINSGGNSGFQAISLAALFGAAKIVLLGYDMQRTSGKSHWHGDHRGGLPNGRGFASWAARMAPLAKDLHSRGIEVYNCTRTTALQCFPTARLEDVL